MMKMVAPHVGAWIEIVRLKPSVPVSLVAPHVGAWIEIIVLFDQLIINEGRSSCRSVD